MASRTPLTDLTLSAVSTADEMGFVALHDLSCAMSDKPRDSYRVIGGHMMTALAARWGLGADLYRETGDADVGVPPVTIRDQNLVEDLLALGYKKVSGSRFERELSDLQLRMTGSDAVVPRSVIDILLPAYTSRPHENKRVGDSIVATETLGLATALMRAPVAMNLHLWRLDGSKLEGNLLFPDEVAALALKALVTTVRSKDTDVVDLWRCLEICQAAGVTPGEFVTNDDLIRAATIIRRLFAERDGYGMRELTAYHGLSSTGTDQRHTRIRALIVSVLGDSRSPTGGATATPW